MYFHSCVFNLVNHISNSVYSVISFVLLYPSSWFLCCVCMLFFCVYMYFSILGVRLWFASFASFRVVTKVVFFPRHLASLFSPTILSPLASGNKGFN